jgi:hypothetical protein
MTTFDMGGTTQGTQKSPEPRWQEMGDLTLLPAKGTVPPPHHVPIVPWWQEQEQDSGLSRLKGQ